MLILQPTRVVKRKAIEHSVELVRRLGDPRFKLVITHRSGDEGDGYLRWLQDFAGFLGVELIFAGHLIAERTGVGPDGVKRYRLSDVYSQADLVAYPSTYEGFGNAFLEAVYFRKPIFCNRYPIYRSDIAPLGFRIIEMAGFLDDGVVATVRALLEDEDRRREMVDQNYEPGRRHFSFRRVERELRGLLACLHCPVCHDTR